LVAGPTPPPGGGGASKITVAKAGSGSGTVTSSPAGIDCGTTCSADFASGDVTLTATPGTSFEFNGWTGACSGTSTCVIPAGSTATANATFSATLNTINHIVFLLQENRSFDHYFGHMNDYRATLGLSTDVDGTPANASNPSFDMTTTVTPFHMNSMCIGNPSPFWNESHKSFNRDNPTSSSPLLNGFVWAGAHFAMDSPPETDTEGRRVMGYYDAGDLPFYHFMAANFAMSDMWFSPVMTRTQPNRMFAIAGTSDGHVYPLPFGSKSSRKTIFEALQDAGITWRIYTPDGAPTLIEGSDLVMFTFGNSHPENFSPSSQFPADAASGNLAQVIFISEGRGTDEHPADAAQGAGGNVDVGSNYVRDNFIMPLVQSPAWKESVFILAWDEGGGFYDHVPPQPAIPPDPATSNLPPTDLQASDLCFGVVPGPGNNCGFNWTGYRVPMMLISPFAKKNYVSHSVADHTAVLKFIETRFSLPNLTERDKAQIDMTEFFDFVNAPWLTPPANIPDQPTNGACYITTLP
jgi:phospholipase C